MFGSMADSSQALPHLADGSSSSGDSSEEQQGVGKVDEWSDWGDEDSGVTTKSLFSSQLFPSAVDAMNFDAAEHGFDLRAVQQQVLRDADRDHMICEALRTGAKVLLS